MFVQMAAVSPNMMRRNNMKIYEKDKILQYAWARGTRIRSLNWAKEYGIIIGYDPDLQMNLVKWDSDITEAVEPAEFEVIR
jgi:hypothetical protein